MSTVKTVSKTFTIEGKEYTVKALQRFDDRGIKIDDHKLDDMAIHQALVMYAKENGYVTSDEIKNFRKKVGLNQKDLAQLLGMSPTTIAMYELDSRPSQSNNKLLQLVISDKNALRKMIANPKIPDRLREKVKNYFHGNSNLIDDYNIVSPFSAIQISHWFLAKNAMDQQLTHLVDPLDEYRLQILLYFSYGKFMAKTHNKLFKERIIRKSCFPFIQKVHNDFNENKNQNDKYYFDYNEIEANRDIITVLQDVIRTYNKYTTYYLVNQLCKNDSALSQTKLNKTINDILIFNEFSK